VVRLAPLLAAAILVASPAIGCGASRSTSTFTTMTPPADGGIRFSVTGGIAGVDQLLVIDASGDASVLTKARQHDTSSRFQISKTELASLREKLDAAGLAQLLSARPSGCVDCFEYSLDYLGQTYNADEVSIPKRLEPAIAALTNLIARHTSGGGPSTSGK
jgi:hypothetical protein